MAPVDRKHPLAEEITLDVAAAVGIVAIATVFSTALVVGFGGTRIGILFLTAVMIAGAARGLISSLMAALLATLTYNYFLTGRPYGFQLPTVDEIHNLVLFSVAAVITGALTGRIQASNRSATRRTAALETLLDVERVAEDAPDESTLLERVSSVVHANLPSLGLTILGPPSSGPPSFGDLAKRSTRPIRLEGETIGVLTWTRGHAEFDDFVELLADRLASFIAGMRARSLAGSLQVERSRNLLLASVSHDFRTPLATIIAATSSLIDFETSLDDKRRLRLIEAARDEAERLDRFVNQILEAMRRAPNGVMAASARSLDVRAHLGALADRFNALALWAQVQVGGRRCHILADEVLFSQAFSNIIENAVKHSPVDAAVKIRVRKSGDQIEIVVTDSGPGVPEADLAGIFDRNFQAGSEKKRSGYGIGLAVARFDLEAIGGELQAANKPGGGLQITARFAAGMVGERC